MAMDVAAIGVARAGVAEDSCQLKERRTYCELDEGFLYCLGTILQGLINLQAGNGGQPDCALKAGVSAESVLSGLPTQSEQVSSRFIQMAVKGTESSNRPEGMVDVAALRLWETLQEAYTMEEQQALSSGKQYIVPERLDGNGEMEQREVLSLLQSSGITGIKGSDSIHATGQIIEPNNTVAPASPKDGHIYLNGMLASGTAHCNGGQYIEGGIEDLKGRIFLEMDLNGKSGALVFPRNAVLTDRSALRSLYGHMGNIKAGLPVIMGKEAAVDEGMDTEGNLDDAKENLNMDSGCNYEEHILETLKVGGRHQPMHSDDISLVLGEKPLEIQQTLAEIAEKVRVLLLEKRSEMEVHLKPPELGRMMVKVAMENGTLAVRITVESEAVKDFLQLHAQELKALLAQDGYKLANIDVNIGQGYQQPKSHDWGNDGHFESAGPNRLRAGASKSHQTIVRMNAYYHGQHSIDCLA